MGNESASDLNDFDSLADEGPSWLGDGPMQAVLLGPHMVGSELNTRRPEVLATLRRAVDLLPLLDAVHRGGQHDPIIHQAVSAFINNAANDWVDLVYDCIHGRGRTAIRSARSLFESSLVAQQLVHDQALCRRYLAHGAITAMSLIESDPTLALRRGKDLRSANHARKKALRFWKPKADEAVTKYGTGFRRQWDSQSVRARAEASGRLSEYDGFRVASATVHASSGALFGTIGTYRDDVRVHRVGPNLNAATVALAYALKPFEIIVSAVRPIAEGPVDQLVAHLEEVRRVWPTFNQVMGEVDAWIWPFSAPEHLVVLALVTPVSTWTYWLLDPDQNVVIECTPEAADAVSAEGCVREMVDRLSIHFPDRDSSQSLHIQGCRGVPKPGAGWRAASEVLPKLEENNLGTMPGVQVHLPGGGVVEWDGDSPTNFRRVASS